MEDVERRPDVVVEGRDVRVQAGRGAAERDFAFPREARPSLVMFTQEKKLIDNPAAARGLATQ